MEAGSPTLCHNTSELSSTALGAQPRRDAWGAPCPTLRAAHPSGGFPWTITSPHPPLCPMQAEGLGGLR